MAKTMLVKPKYALMNTPLKAIPTPTRRLKKNQFYYNLLCTNEGNETRYPTVWSCNWNVKQHLSPATC
jgi:heat shock protein HspQ